MGVFATRSPFRPNPIGLSSVKLVAVEHSATDGDVLVVSGADILNGTYPPGSQLPTVRALATDASVNPNTMQKALSMLESVSPA